MTVVSRRTENNGVLVELELEQAYRTLEIPKTSTMREVKRAYHDLALVWHPDRHIENERLQRKALKKMIELNAAYHCICIHLNPERATAFAHEEPENNDFTATIIECPGCCTKNRIPLYRKDAVPKCGRCGVHLFREQYKKTYGDFPAGLSRLKIFPRAFFTMRACSCYGRE